MSELSRRDFAKLAGAAGASVLAGSSLAPIAYAQGRAKVVIIGGGPGGATVAHYVKKGAPELDVTLIEVNRRFTTCFFSNLYLGGFRSFDSITHSYSNLRKMGIKIVRDWATSVDTSKRVVSLRSGKKLSYDKLVVSPGIDIKYDSVPGYSVKVAQTLPHAWQAGPQTQLLKRQLTKMRNGGVVVLAAPPNPYRCPPGPYERAAMIAHYLKTHKPKSKLIVLDPKKSFSKQPAFMEAYGKYYKGIIDVRLTTEIDNFALARVDPRARMVETKSGEKIKFDVANIVPAQRAGQIAFKAGLTQGDWCPVVPDTFASTKAKDVYVLGDASVATQMPKSGFSANSQARVVASDILAALAKKEKFVPRFRNTCWSLVAPNDSIKVGASYKPEGGILKASGGFVSKPGETAEVRRQNYLESVDWYAGIVTDVFAKSAPAKKPARKKG